MRHFAVDLEHEFGKTMRYKSIRDLAFSEAQQGEIEAALDRLGEEDAGFRNRLEEEMEREEDGQFCGLFVKNLENVQGDERDIIILSICYGHDAAGRMLMNFGPINQIGGEKRLNVIFSRARKHMVVVSSIRHLDITNEYNDGANCLRNYLEYAAAVSHGDRATAHRVLQHLSPSRAVEKQQQARDAIIAAIQQALQLRGYLVDAQVGQSQFCCDLAVRAQEDTAYRLAILVDTTEHYANANLLERYLLRPGILTAFGWRVAFVLSKDWQQDPDDVLQRLERLLNHEPADADVSAPVPEEPDTEPEAPVSTPQENVDHAETISTKAPVEVEPIAPQRQEPTARATDAPITLFRSLEFREGSSSKFWEVTVQDNRYIVRFGRIGTNGQVQVKEFETPAGARHEAEKMIREKLGKGYVEKDGR